MSERVSILFVVPSKAVDAPPVQETLRSISAQTYPSSLIEVVQVRYVPGEPGAHTSALNAAREGAGGAFVVHAEPGVVWDANKVERQVEQLRANPSAGAAVHRMTVRDRQGRTQALDLADFHRYGPRIACLLRPPWGPGAGMLRGEVSAQLGVFRNVEEALWEYAVRLTDRGHTLDLMDEDLAVWNLDDLPQERRPMSPEGVRHRFLKSYLDRTDPGTLFSGGHSEPGGRLLLAGLHQKNDDLEACHGLCQEVGRESACAEASYWHGIVHRREPDFANARGWFKKASRLGALAEIYRDAIAFLQRVLQVPDYGAARETAHRLVQHLQSRESWDPLYFVDLCEACMEGGAAEEARLLAEVQEVEFNAMFDWTYRMATG